MTAFGKGGRKKRKLREAGPKREAGGGKREATSNSEKSRAKASRAVDPRTKAGTPDLSVALPSALADAKLPSVGIVILNLNGKHHLEDLFESLGRLNYPSERWKVILVDNASSDGSVEELRARWPKVELHVNERNVGFSAGCNQGAREAGDVDVFVFLNNDIRVEPDWLRELVSPVAQGVCQATTAKMFAWDGKTIDSAGGGMNFHGIGIQDGYREVPAAHHDLARKTLFACGGAMAIDAEIFRDVGGFDEKFFAYYEDVDLGWRMWVLGHECWYVPAAVCYHHHSSTSRRLPAEMIRLLQVRNPLIACLKNYGEENLKRVWPAAVSLALRRTFVMSGFEDLSPFRIEHAEMRSVNSVRRLWERARAASDDTVPLKRVAAADLIGLNDVLGNWDYWQTRRAEVQDRRKRPDEEIFDLFLRPFWCIEGEPAYESLQRGLESMFGLDSLFAEKERPGSDPSP